MRRTKNDRLEAKLYRDTGHDGHWIAWSPKIGWVAFPARPNGWAQREPIAELDAMRLCEVPLARAFNTSLLEAFRRVVQPAAHTLSG
ncbi:hypothetical protein SBA6_270014 [Candidatus Sulfopaludibacter sp. SbA6]|nr:hypothetical protein SBA6_270014 [Candidatus Sulfopaludibacter sp. SbA6]